MGFDNAVRFDFGNTATTSTGWRKVDRVYRSPCYGLLRDVSAPWYETGLEHPFKDYLCAEGRLEFRLGLAPGAYRLKLYFFDPRGGAGPITVRLLRTRPTNPEGAGDCAMVLGVTPGADAPALLEMTYEHPGGVLGVLLESAQGDVLINAMEVIADRPDFLVPMYPEAPRHELPSAAEVDRLPEAAPEAFLGELCRWLLARRDQDGFMGDYESNKRLWYTAAYPVRVLLAGHALAPNPSQLAAVTTIIDRFVAEQMPEGGFVQSVLGIDVKAAGPQALDKIRSENWMNLADIGSMVAALIATCHYVQGERRAAYIAAARRYLDHWATPRIQENGGVKNGWLGAAGEAKNVYGVSTAMTALCMALFARLTGEEAYLHTAEKSVCLLVDGWGEDGWPLNWNFDTEYPGKTHHIPAIYFGDTYYIYEAMSAVIALTGDAAVRRRIYEAYKAALFGSRGLLAMQAGRVWWPLQNIWHNSKSAGSLIVLQDFLYWAGRLGEDEALVRRAREACHTLCRFLLRRDCAAMLGVMLEDPSDIYPFGPHSLQSWTGCAVAATGFAGIAAAQMAQYGIVYQTRLDAT